MEILHLHLFSARSISISVFYNLPCCLFIYLCINIPFDCNTSLKAQVAYHRFSIRRRCFCLVKSVGSPSYFVFDWFRETLQTQPFPRTEFEISHWIRDTDAQEVPASFCDLPDCSTRCHRFRTQTSNRLAEEYLNRVTLVQLPYFISCHWFLG